MRLVDKFEMTLGSHFGLPNNLNVKEEEAKMPNIEHMFFMTYMHYPSLTHIIVCNYWAAFKDVI